MCEYVYLSLLSWCLTPGFSNRLAALLNDQKYHPSLLYVLSNPFSSAVYGFSLGKSGKARPWFKGTKVDLKITFSLI
jgi:hypothetical protein